ncbi:MAG: hypothetical protein AAGF97_06630 [Planctomycetota bacterium]
MKSKVSTRRRLHAETLEARRMLNADLPGDIIYHEDFESGDGGFAIDNSGGTYLGLWHYSVGRRSDGLPNHSPDHSFYYGRFETATGGGRYDVVPGDHQGRIRSPQIQLPAAGESTLMFNYLLGTRPELDVDFVEVWVDDGTDITRLLSRQEGTLPDTQFDWHCVQADLTPFNGQQVQLVFSFDTGEYPRVDPEGWYIDDIWIKNVPPTVSGYKWLDTDGDGVWDDDEVGGSGWTIYVDANDNAVRDPEELWTTTANDGSYAFDLELLDGETVIIREELFQNWIQTSPGADGFGHAVTAADLPLQGTLGVAGPGNFGNVAPDILGYAWHDENINGDWDPGEEGLNDWTVYLDLNQNGQHDDDEPLSVTGTDSRHDGVFWFVAPSGSYVVRELVADGWVQTFPGGPVGSPPNFEHVVVVEEAFAAAAVMDGDGGSSQNPVGDFGVAASPNFGNAFEIEIGGRKFYDRGTPNDFAGDQPLPGWQILAYVDDDQDGMLNDAERQAGAAMMATTNDSGEWVMRLSPSVDYVVVESLPDGWRQRAPQVEVLAADVMDVGLGRFGYSIDSTLGNQADLDFGNHETAVVGGIKFHDRNADGNYDPEVEERLADWVIVAYRDLNEDGDLDEDERDAGGMAAVTDADGAYQLELLATPHILVEVLAADWLQASPDTEVLDVSIRDEYPEVGNGTLGRRGYALDLLAGDDLQRDFGNLRVGTLQGVKFADVDADGQRDSDEDLDGDGILDPGEDLDGDGRLDVEEQGLSGWTIELYQDADGDGLLSPGDPKIAESLTAADGSYAFEAVPGDYILQELSQPGWTQTSPDPNDCTTEACEGRYRVTLGSEESRQALDFGNAPNGVVRGEKVFDINRDGIPDAEEARLPDWQVEVYLDANGNQQLDSEELIDPVATAVTDATGSYELTINEPGDYIVVEVTQPGLIQRGAASPGCGVTVLDEAIAGDLGLFGHPVSLAAGSVVEGLDFCNGPNTPGATLEGLTFADDNRDGVPQADEPATAMRRIAAFEDLNQNGILDASELIIDPVTQAIEPLLTTVTNSLKPENYTLLFTDGAIPEEGVPIILLAEVLSGETQTVPRTNVMASGLGPIFPLYIEDEMSVESVRLGAYGYHLLITPNDQVNGLNFGTSTACTGKRCFLAGSSVPAVAQAPVAPASTAVVVAPLTNVLPLASSVPSRRTMSVSASSPVIPASGADAVFAASDAVADEDESTGDDFFSQLSALPRWYRLRNR